MILRWFFSKTVRHASAMGRHVRRLLAAQQDILSTEASSAIQASLADLQSVIRAGGDRSSLNARMGELETVANRWLKPYPHPAWRENIEVLLVALAVAMGIRTFFLQPFKIPTGSMQPTLFGVTSENLLKRPDYQIPTGLARVKDWFAGISYVEIKAKSAGQVEMIKPPVRFLIFSLMQKLQIGGQTYTLWFPPDYGQPPAGSLQERAELKPGQSYQPGETVVRLKVQSGDHLFVNRMTYNFRPPRRGEIVVFQTAGIEDPRMPQDQFYIKRLVALGGEAVQIGNDRHLRINGVRLDASVPYFENVYSFDPKAAPADSAYSGHVNETVANQFGRRGLAREYFPSEDHVHKVSPDGMMVMGDNTLNSFDSRGWGEFPARNVIGKSFFVYWPITYRFGWGQQ